MFKKILIPLDGSEIAAKILPKVTELAKTFLAKAGQDLKGLGLEADWVCKDGHPAQQIIAYAQDKGYDLIALGTHGAGEVAWYMGHIADRVAAHATVPVLIFRTLEFKPPMLKELYSYP